MTAIAPQFTALSLAEFLNRPETKPASEFINGCIYQKAMPQGKHSRIQTRFSAEINQRLELNRVGCAFTELRCTFGSRSIVPDISVFAWERIPFNPNGEIENAFAIHPDWTIEILSPGQSPIRVIDNIVFCLNQGTQIGWLIDPEDKLVLVFQPNQLPVTKQLADETLPVLAGLNDWQLNVGELFSWLNFGS
jgi:Uma2 family endonuclease